MQQQLDQEKDLFAATEKNKQDVSIQLETVTGKKNFLLQKQNKFKQFNSIQERNN